MITERSEEDRGKGYTVELEPGIERVGGYQMTRVYTLGSEARTARRKTEACNEEGTEEGSSQAMHKSSPWLNETKGYGGLQMRQSAVNRGAYFLFTPLASMDRSLQRIKAF